MPGMRDKPDREDFLARAPEARIALFGFLAAFVWEIWQMPFYRTSSLSFMDAVKGCTMGSLGDAGIMVATYTIAAWIGGSRYWVTELSRLPVITYLCTGLVVTIAFEQIALNVSFGWRYSELMPIDPFFGIGLVPIAMWVVVPLVTLALVRIPPLSR